MQTTITARTSKQLSDQIDRINADLDDPYKLHLNWGREGKKKTWFAHDQYGRDMKTGLSFSDVVAYVQGKLSLTKDIMSDQRD